MQRLDTLRRVWVVWDCEGKFLQFILKYCDSCSTYTYSGIKSNKPNLLFLSLRTTTEVVKFACAFKLGSALLKLYCQTCHLFHNNFKHQASQNFGLYAEGFGDCAVNL